MADLASFAIGMASSGTATLAGTITADDEWVHVVGTLSIDPGLYRYGNPRVLGDGSITAGFALVATDPLVFARLPNPPYGARIIYTDDLSSATPNAMTELDSSYFGVEADAEFPQLGRYLFSQVRSTYLYDDGSTGHELGPNGITGPVEFETHPFWVVNEDFEWVMSDPDALTQPARDEDIKIVSRGSYTYMLLGGPAIPGAVTELDIQWWNGPGFRCGDYIGSVLAGPGIGGARPVSNVVVGSPAAGRSLTKAQLVALYTRHNFPDPNLAAAIALAESGGNASAINTSNDDGSIDYGLLQINSVHGYDPVRLMDPDYNADAGYAVSSGGTDWTPWVTFNSGAYETFL